MLHEYEALQKCIDGAAIDGVKHAIKIGNSLDIIKAGIKHGEWLHFIKKNFSISIRSCQNFMYLAKQPIARKYYKLGTEELLMRLRNGEDLSF
jgi:hypothetical protein